MAGPKTLKLIQYQQTQDLLRGINHEAQSGLTGSTGDEGQTSPGQAMPSSSFALRDLRRLVSQRDMSLMRSHLETMIEVLTEHEKQTGVPDSLKSDYSRLLNRINLDPDKVSLSEFEEAIKRFSSNNEYTLALQDEINNKSLDLQVNPEAEEEIGGSENISDFPQQDQDQQQQQGEEPPRQEESSDNQPARQSPRQEPRRVQQQKKSAEEKSIDRHNRKLEKRKPENKEARKKARKERRQQRKARDKFNNSRLRRGLKQANKALNAPNRLSNRLGERFANSRLGRGLSKLNNMLGAPGRFLSRLGNRFATRFLNNSFGRGLGRLGRGLNKLDRFLNPIEHYLDRLAWRLASQAAKLLGQLAVNAARLLANLAAKALSQLAAQAAGTAARTALMTAGRGVVGLLGIGVAGIVWIAIAALIIFTIWSLYDSNSECGQPGKVEAVKSTAKESYSKEENIQYKIVVRYIVKCDNAYADIEVKDNIPSGTNFIPGSTKPGIFEENFYLLPPEGILDGNTIIWRLNRFQPNIPIYLVFSVKPTADNLWVSNQATVGYKTYTSGFFGIGSGATGAYSDAAGLLPGSLNPVPASWTEVKALVIGAFNKHPELIERYKEASAQTGVPWQLLAGIHFVEKANGPGPDTSLVSGRVIGQAEPDINPAKCAAGHSGPGIPVPVGGGCGFSNQIDSMIYAAKHLAEKIGKTPSTFQETVSALSKYNGGGNANCGEGLPYGPCPPQFKGEDDPYAIADFDEAHSSNKMYLIFCGDGAKCNPPKIFGRPGVMGVIRTLIEEGL